MSDQDNGGGRRKDGKPYAEDNTREDGSYKTGYGRTPEHSRFAKNDNRKRGQRAAGTKNLMTEWREELDTKVTLTEGGKTKKITKRRALIKANIDRGIKKSDRANEGALRYAALSEKREPGVQADDLAIIEAWFAGLQHDGDSDDSDQLARSSDVIDAASGEAPDEG